MALANENTHADKWEPLPKLTGSVFIIYQASDELEEARAEKPVIHPKGQDRRSEAIAVFPLGLTGEPASREKCGPAGNRPGSTAWDFLTRRFTRVGTATIPVPCRQGMPCGQWGHIALVGRTGLLLCDTPRVLAPVGKA